MSTITIREHPRGVGVGMDALAKAIHSVGSRRQSILAEGLCARLTRDLTGAAHYLIAEHDGRIIAYIRWAVRDVNGTAVIELSELGLVDAAVDDTIANRLLTAAEARALRSCQDKRPWNFLLTIKPDETWVAWAKQHGYTAELAIHRAMAGTGLLTLKKRVRSG